MTYALPMRHPNRVGRVGGSWLWRRSVWGRKTARLNAFEIGEKRAGRGRERRGEES